ncbi:MAG: hypothetical protein CL607_02845 [Anaerolineaceae bacterium]|nr:hypothetical protein [Anaerolineaceae bacterium]
MSSIRWFLILIVNTALIFMSYFVSEYFSYSRYGFFLFLGAAIMMTFATWLILNVDVRRAGDNQLAKQKRGQQATQLESDMNDLQARLARLETIAAAGYVNGQRPERVELEERLARLETIAAAEHLSDHPEDWDQIDIKRKRGLN